MQPAEWIPAIQRGDLNGFFGWEPWLSKLPQIVKGAQACTPGRATTTCTINGCSRGLPRGLGEAEPGLAGAVYNSLAEATDWAIANKEEAIDMCAKKFRLNKADLPSRWPASTTFFDTKREFYDRYKAMAGLGERAAATSRSTTSTSS